MHIIICSPSPEAALRARLLHVRAAVKAASTAWLQAHPLQRPLPAARVLVVGLALGLAPKAALAAHGDTGSKLAAAHRLPHYSVASDGQVMEVRGLELTWLCVLCRKTSFVLELTVARPVSSTLQFFTALKLLVRLDASRLGGTVVAPAKQQEQRQRDAVPVAERLRLGDDDRLCPSLLYAPQLFARRGLEVVRASPCSEAVSVNDGSGEARIDVVMADMEAGFQSVGRALLKLLPWSAGWLRTLVTLLLVFPFLLLACVVLVLPAFYSLLLWRVRHIETSSESFGLRQALLMRSQGHTLCRRVACAMARAVPFVLFIVAWPVVALQALAPHVVDPRLLIGITLALLAVLLLTGTLRASRGFSRHEASVRQQTEVYEWC